MIEHDLRSIAQKEAAKVRLTTRRTITHCPQGFTEIARTSQVGRLEPCISCAESNYWICLSLAAKHDWDNWRIRDVIHSTEKTT